MANCGHLLCDGCRKDDCACGARSVFRPRVPCRLVCRVAGVEAPALSEEPCEASFCGVGLVA